MVDLARILGESHWIERVCLGPRNDHWRVRMQQLLKAETADRALNQRISLAFNAGYGSAKALYLTCNEAARTEAQRIAKTGESLSEKLAGP